MGKIRVQRGGGEAALRGAQLEPDAGYGRFELERERSGFFNSEHG
jgi:hypothetical protein